MESRLPSIQTVRERIEAIGKTIDPRYPNTRRVPKYTDLEQLKMAHKYQFLIAGRVSEVAGKYRPEGPENAFKIDMNGEPSVLFPVKSGKRRNPRGFILRGPCIPLRRDYETWAREVMDYINDNPQPFSFQKHPDTSKRTMEAASSYIFQGLEWVYSHYNRPIGNEIVDGKGKLSYEKIPTRWKSFANMCIRKARTIDLFVNYRFDTDDVNIYGGWRDIDNNPARIPTALRFYLEMDIGEANQENRDLLTRIAERYFHKLCKPIPLTE